MTSEIGKSPARQLRTNHESLESLPIQSVDYNHGNACVKPADGLGIEQGSDQANSEHAKDGHCSDMSLDSDSEDKPDKKKVEDLPPDGSSFPRTEWQIAQQRLQEIMGTKAIEAPSFVETAVPKKTTEEPEETPEIVAASAQLESLFEQYLPGRNTELWIIVVKKSDKGRHRSSISYLECVKEIVVNPGLYDQMFGCPRMEAQRRDHEMRMYPITVDDLSHPVFKDLMSRCSQFKPRFQKALDSDGNVITKGMLTVRLLKECDFDAVRAGILADFPNMNIDEKSNYDPESFEEKFDCHCRRTPAKKDRSLILIPKLPGSVTEDQLWEMFPSAWEIYLIPPQPATSTTDGRYIKNQPSAAYVYFPTIEQSVKATKELGAKPRPWGMSKLTLIPFTFLKDPNGPLAPPPPQESGDWASSASTGPSLAASFQQLQDPQVSGMPIAGPPPVTIQKPPRLEDPENPNAIPGYDKMQREIAFLKSRQMQLQDNIVRRVPAVSPPTVPLREMLPPPTGVLPGDLDLPPARRVLLPNPQLAPDKTITPSERLRRSLLGRHGDVGGPQSSSHPDVGSLHSNVGQTKNVPPSERLRSNLLGRHGDVDHPGSGSHRDMGSLHSNVGLPPRDLPQSKAGESFRSTQGGSLSEKERGLFMLKELLNRGGADKVATLKSLVHKLGNMQSRPDDSQPLPSRAVKRALSPQDAEECYSKRPLEEFPRDIPPIYRREDQFDRGLSRFSEADRGDFDYRQPIHDRGPDVSVPGSSSQSSEMYDPFTATSPFPRASSEVEQQMRQADIIRHHYTDLNPRQWDYN